MERIWTMGILASCLVCLLSARGPEGARVLLDSGTQAVELGLRLTASMMLWSGLMEQLNISGDVKRLGSGLRRMLRRLYPGVQDDEAWAAVGMNVAANLLGLGNAATPAGIRAAQRLAKCGEQGVRALAMLLAVNNSSLQLIPATVTSLRSAAGAANPADIWLPTLLASGASTVVAVAFMLLAQGRSKN